MTLENNIAVTRVETQLDVEMCTLDELESTLLEQLNDGWRVAQIRAYDLHRREQMKAYGLSHGYIDEQRPDVELEYLGIPGTLKTVLAVGEVQAVSIMVFDNGNKTPSELTMLGSATRLGNLECVRLPSCGETELSWAYIPQVLAGAVSKRGFANGENRVIDALTLLAGNLHFRGQQIQLLEALRRHRGYSKRWDGLIARVEKAQLADDVCQRCRAPVVVDGLDECLMGLVGQRLVEATESLQARLKKVA